MCTLGGKTLIHFAYVRMGILQEDVTNYVTSMRLSDHVIDECGKLSAKRIQDTFLHHCGEKGNNNCGVFLWDKQFLTPLVISPIFSS